MTLPPSGIYKITNLKNSKVYIGQSENMFKRRKQHFSALEYGHHQNKQMQEDFTKQKGKGFRWDVVEYCNLRDLNRREKYWIEHYNSLAPFGYNQGWVPFKRKVIKKKTTNRGRYGHS